MKHCFSPKNFTHNHLSGKLDNDDDDDDSDEFHEFVRENQKMLVPLWVTWQRISPKVLGIKSILCRYSLHRGKQKKKELKCQNGS